MTLASRRAWMVTALAATPSLVFAAIAQDWGPPAGMPQAGWVVVAVLVGFAERFRIHLHQGRETHTFSLAELPTAIGLFLLPPVMLVAARAVGSAGSLLTRQRRSPVKLAFNVANAAFEATVAALVFHPFVSAVDQTTGLYAAALLSVALGSTAGIVVVWCVIRVVERVRGVRQLLDAIQLGVPIGLANAALGVLFVLVVAVSPYLVWLPAVPLLTMFVAYRAYAAQWQHRDALDFLYDTAVDAHASPELGEALLTLILRARRHLRAEMAELVAVRSHADGTVTVASVDADDAHEVRQIALDDLPLDMRRLLAGRDGVETGAVAQQMVWVRSEVDGGGAVLLRVRDPVGNEAAFAEVDLEILRSLARLAVTAVERAELDELKAAFLSAVSHELRTPLTVVLAASATLRDRADRLDEDRRQQLAERLHDQAQRLDRLLSDLLDLDRLTRGTIEPRRRETDLVVLTRRVAATFDLDGHELRIGADGSAAAHVDPALTERIVENLLKNAVKYSPPGTVVTVDLVRDDAGITIVVEDEGSGVPESERDRVFDPFVRLHHDHPQPGTGVGLTLVRRFAQMHDGDAAISASPTGGTRVVVHLRDDVAGSGWRTLPARVPAP